MVDDLAEEAVRRAWLMLVDGAPSGLSSGPRADLARRAAWAAPHDLPELADRAGVTVQRLRAWADAWRLGGDVAVTVVADDLWSTDPTELEAARERLVEAGFSRRSVAVNYDSLRLAGNVWLVLGPTDGGTGCEDGPPPGCGWRRHPRRTWSTSSGPVIRPQVGTPARALRPRGTCRPHRGRAAARRGRPRARTVATAAIMPPAGDRCVDDAGRHGEPRRRGRRAARARRSGEHRGGHPHALERCDEGQLLRQVVRGDGDDEGSDTAARRAQGGTREPSGRSCRTSATPTPGRCPPTVVRRTTGPRATRGRPLRPWPRTPGPSPRMPEPPRPARSQHHPGRQAGAHRGPPTPLRPNRTSATAARWSARRRRRRARIPTCL